MNPRRKDLLVQALRDLDCVFSDESRWDELIRRAREADLLGTIAHRLEMAGRLHDVPAAPRMHLRSAGTLCAAQHRAVMREVREIAHAVAPLGIPIVLLKGAAYLVAELPPACGRLFSDVDILIPKAALPEVEATLMLAGYATTHDNPYDQRYYRRWMHELPPMQHIRRMTVLDVHHAIVPQTARVQSDADALLKSAVRLPRHPGISVLAPSDMVLHSATHLFHNEEFTHGLRDLVDIHELLRHFSSDPGFWSGLLSRAEELNLARPLYYAFVWSTRLLGTEIPREIIEHADRHAPSMPVRAVMDCLLAQAMQPTAREAPTRWSRRALYVRGHWLKMSFWLLTWHLAVKTFRRNEPATAPVPPPHP